MPAFYTCSDAGYLFYTFEFILKIFLYLWVYCKNTFDFIGKIVIFCSRIKTTGWPIYLLFIFFDILQALAKHRFWQSVNFEQKETFRSPMKLKFLIFLCFWSPGPKAATLPLCYSPNSNTLLVVLSKSKTASQIIL